MERLVKERLVGAAVLMAAAIILVPEMLSGPDHRPTDSTQQGSTSRSTPQARSDAPIKTYTIDLTRSPGAQPVVPPDDNRAPPPEAEPEPGATATAPASTPPAAAGNDEAGNEGAPAKPANPQATAQAEPETVARTAGPTTPDVVEKVVEPATNAASAASRPQPAPQPQTAPRALASGVPAPTSGAWAVQLGSFSRQSTAERLVRELQAKGHAAFVMPVRSGSATLYRVRIGPMKERSSAETTLRAVQSIAPGAAIVAQP